MFFSVRFAWLNILFLALIELKFLSLPQEHPVWRVVEYIYDAKVIRFESLVGVFFCISYEILFLANIFSSVNLESCFMDLVGE